MNVIFNYEPILTPLLSFCAFIIAITVHECAHAYVADRLGDPTARIMGRLTLNPLPHIDIIGTIILPILLSLTGTGFVIGWAKPVQFDPFNLRHPRRDSAIISLAGALSNFLLAILCAIAIRLLLNLNFAMLSNPTAAASVDFLVKSLLLPLTILNTSLGVFNLVPIHPLDGFKVVEGILPEEYAGQWHQLEPYGFIFLLFLIFPIFGGIPILNRLIFPVVNTILSILLPGWRAT